MSDGEHTPDGDASGGLTRGAAGSGAGFGVEEVRRQWARVVADAADGTQVVIHAPHGVRAVLGPPTPDVLAAQGELPAFTMTAARQGLGNLVRAAAAGTPQLVLRYRRVYAQITHTSTAPHTTGAGPAAPARRASPGPDTP
ncbi:hypothetical protein ABZS54_41900, partial [Embleya sp. NPDC005575]